MTEQKLFDISDDKLDAVLKIVYESPINITENMILERLRDRYRWPKSYNSGYPSLERIVKDDGLKEQDFFASDNHIQSHTLVYPLIHSYTLIYTHIH